MASGENSSPAALGIIGGTGLYDIPGFSPDSGGTARWISVDSAFGKPSDDLLIGDTDGQRIVFLPRHGRGHRIPPTQVNYRANIEALKRAGVDQIISFSAVGSLKDGLEPGTFVLVDQYIDRTIAREKSFFGEGFAAHVSMADPVCGRLGEVLSRAALAAGAKVARGGTYLVMEGPQFSTRAESQLYRSWDCDVIGMTNMPEAKLAREAEICYATVAMVTDYDSWHATHEAVTASAILKVLAENIGHAREVIRKAVPLLAGFKGPCASGCDRALDHAIASATHARSPEMVRRLEYVAGRALKAKGWA